MKTYLIFSILACILVTGCTTSPSSWPAVSDDGLTRVDHKRSSANAVYIQDGTDFSGYEKIMLVEPSIAFRKYWKDDVNSSRRLDRITDADMEKMITRGKQLLTEEFTKRLEKGGYAVVDQSGPDVLEVKASVVNLDVYAPDPDNIANTWTRTYTRGSGEATLILELYDSVSNQLLARAIDRRVDDQSYMSRIPRSQTTNIADARFAFSSWAGMLVKGLEEAKLGTFKPVAVEE
jgi:hypothetical protein